MDRKLDRKEKLNGGMDGKQIQIRERKQPSIEMGMMEWIGGGQPQDVPLSLVTPGKLLYASTWAAGLRVRGCSPLPASQRHSTRSRPLESASSPPSWPGCLLVVVLQPSEPMLDPRKKRKVEPP
jgi:hypothetical protein